MALDKQIEYRKLFSVFYRGLVKSVKFPDAGIVLDYFIEPSTGEAVSWQSKVAAFMSSNDAAGANMMVSTADTVRLTYLLDLLVRNNRPCMFVGSSGTGKLPN